MLVRSPGSIRFGLLGVLLGTLISGSTSSVGLGADPASDRGPEAHPRKWAVLIGVDRYVDDRLETLRYCGADALALRDTLVSRAGFPDDQVHVMHDKHENPDRQPLAKLIRRVLTGVFAQVRKEDLVVVAFSGHGIHAQGMSYLCPRDADLDHPAATMLSVVDLYRMLDSECPAAQKLVLVDVCRNDPSARSSAESMSKGLADALRRVPEGILVLSSCKAEQKSYEDEGLKHGVFMYYVMEGLSGKADERGPGLRGNGDGLVDVGELYNYAFAETSKKVFDHWTRAQTPEKWGVERGPIDLVRLEPRPVVVAQPAITVSSPATPSDEPARQITNSIGMKLMLIPAGEFMMGSPESEEGRESDEGPLHRVRIRKPFYLGQYEVTQAEYERVMGANPSSFSADGDRKEWVWGQDTSRFPVETVSWEEAVEFCRKLSQQEGRTYRLPTEAEWEYACRGGTTTPFSFGSVLNGREAKCDGDYPYGTSEKGPYLARSTTVGSYRPNVFGLYDMHGNVWEWCADWYDSSYYGNSPVDDPPGPSGGSYRVNRGGGWDYDARVCRSANRINGSPELRFYSLGFRVARVAAE